MRCIYVKAKKPKGLFMCSHNCARSQMAEALLIRLYGEQMEAESAGLDCGTVNPLAIEAMRLIGIDISQARSKTVFEVYKTGAFFTYFITVCDETSAERCPIFPGATRCLHWSFPDPNLFEGAWEEKLAKTVEVREMITTAIHQWRPSVLTKSAA